MGKQKGERSKNRPSSSSLAASLLPSGASAVGFGGYLGSSRIEPPSSSAEESTSVSDVDSEVAQHLKRLGRKDPTTKIKALTSLDLLFKQKSAEEIGQIVPQWAFEYKRLLLDYNREVRRATHGVMTSLAVTVRKGLLPHLKSLMGPWWFSQFDPVPEVSQAAKRSLEAAFPASARRLDALMLCVNEIFLYLDENLKLTPQAMSDKATPMDELEDMYQRVISSSLLALATLIDILLGMTFQVQDSESATAEQKLASRARLTTISAAEKMFSVHKFFLEFYRSKSPAVRSATYSVLTSFTKHIPHVYSEGSMKTVSAAILGVFLEKDVSCHSSMWDMLLVFLRKFPDSWSKTNVQKGVLPRLWNFLRHGCYGSQQLSYPALVLFLESVPPKAVAWEEFIFNFFDSLWAGRNPLHSSSTDILSFFKALKECFLWALHNASRYCTGEDITNPLRVKLISNILVSLLWQDYFLLGNAKSKDKRSQKPDGSAEDVSQLLDEQSSDTLSAGYTTNYVQELGKCIVGILVDIHSKESSLLSVFSISFHNDSLEMFKHGECLSKFSELVERLSNFFHLLDQYSWQKGQTWPLDYLAGPLVADSFSMIKSLDSPEAVRFLSNLIEIFGPVKLFAYFHSCSQGHCTDTSENGSSETEMNLFLQTFRTEFVPWSLQRYTRSSSAKLDLLIDLVQDKDFSEQWCSIIGFATTIDKSMETEISITYDIGQVEVLAIFFEKLRAKLSRMKHNSVQKIGSLPEHWKHKLLDSAAVSIASHSLSTMSCARFLCSVLGGSLEDDRTCFISGEAVISIFEEILKNLVSLIYTSSFEWARLLCPSLVSCESIDSLQIEKSTFDDNLKKAQFSFEVLEGSLFCLKMLGENCMLLPRILAVTFILDWECSMSSLLSEENCNHSVLPIVAPGTTLEEHYKEQLQQIDAKLTLGRRMHAFRHKTNTSFWRSFSASNFSTIKSILVQAVRSAAFERNNATSDQISSLCCDWVLELQKVICHDQAELQSLLDKIISEDSSWSFWVAPLLQGESRSAMVQVKKENACVKESRHDQFIAFAEKLNSSLGFSTVIGGVVSQTHFSSTSALVERVEAFSYSRAWLAAELLCTWRWQGGSVFDSFLPSLRRYAKLESSNPNLLFSILKILLSGALMEGSSSIWISFDTWTPSDDEVEKIHNPFLRALTSLLSTLFNKDRVWRKHEAVELFELVVDKLFVESTLNRTCLRIIPFVLGIIIEPLLLCSSEFDESSKDVLLAPWKDDLVLKNILMWLERALSFPSLVTGVDKEDPEEWLQLIMSCYPLRNSGEPGTFKVEVVRDINHLEKTLLLNLFRKHRNGTDTSEVRNEMSSASSNQATISSTSTQLILAKLTSILVGYCWREFSEDDWFFVLDSLQSWVESSVLLMEEMAEKIDDIVMNLTSKANLELLVEKLERAVLSLDPKPIDISKNALVVLSLSSQFFELEDADGMDILQSVRLGKWPQIKDRIMESILRLFFATGVAEAIASSLGDKVSSVIASHRLAYSQFWERLASFVIHSPENVRNTAMKSMELWGLSKGPISSLYAILFSPIPIPSLQIAAYRLISTEPFCHLSVLKESCLGGNAYPSLDYEVDKFESSSGESFSLMDEISCQVQKPASDLLDMDLVSQDRVNFFLAWAILLSYLHSLPPSSQVRESLVQYVQESVSSAVLDCIFQNIPLKQAASYQKKKEVELVSEASAAANAAKHVIASGSVQLSLGTLWPLGTEQMASLAGSVYGMMISLLPSYVRNWFTSLRDRSLLSAIETFTKMWCSPSLLSNELSQVKETIVADENFSVSVNKSTYEIVATYKKEETGMDLVIRLPSCYPLRPGDVDCTRSLGISEVKKRKWLLSLTAFIRNQNGAIGEAIRVWKSNLDKEFLGVEECPICYSIIHTTNHTLPRLACKTCKHKFHSACLYKWFSTSHKSTCPLCQTPF